jgi:formate dehydrogenase iron-sulfur subunit
VRLTLAGLGVEEISFADAVGTPAKVPPLGSSLIPARPLEEGEQYRFHFDMTKCIGCRSCEVACNEQNGNPADLRWRRIGEIEGGTYPDTQRHYLSMGCNHCLDADCLKGCPVDAYKKDPVTGIVLHSADACIGCQYCVWNCPYSVPQFNPERGVVGKCDMCHGRLTDGLEPACVNACPEAAIEIEIVNMAAWRQDYASAESPGMPEAGHTISTTRITLPPPTASVLERVDAGRIRPEHAHLSLVTMTTLMQSVTGCLATALLYRRAGPILLTILLGITCIALSASVFHLGRPAYAWRALKMWRRSWLSREVLLFGLFLLALTLFTSDSWLCAFQDDSSLLHHLQRISPIAAKVLAQSVWMQALSGLGWLAATLGLTGTMASAFIYLVPARPAWNTAHTPIDFLLSGAMMGTTLLPVLLSNQLTHFFSVHVDLSFLSGPALANVSPLPAVFFALLWSANQFVRLIRLHRSSLFEANATIGLLKVPRFRNTFAVAIVLAFAVAILSEAGLTEWALAAALGAVLLSRYLFFVTVVPLNMALTFVRASQ